jgi:cation diffusion facilitator family transporter
MRPIGNFYPESPRFMVGVGSMSSPHHHHSHEVRPGPLETGAAGMRAAKVSFLILAATAAIQAGIALASGSVALYSDTLHNITDALTAVPLWIAFSIGRRQRTSVYTYGFNRAEDLAGILIVAAIGFSAVVVIWESIGRLFEPRTIDHIPWVIVAGAIGAAGNEWVARYRIRVGNSIGSEALTADGHHARADALTSVAVVVAGIGAALGADWIDPIAGLLVGASILWLLYGSARRILRRLLDGIDPEIVTRARTAILQIDGVREIGDLQARWHGHQLLISASIAVDADLTVRAGHETAEAVEHELQHTYEVPVVATIHVDPYGTRHSHQSPGT